MSVRGGLQAGKVPDISGLMDFDEELKTHEQRRKRSIPQPQPDQLPIHTRMRFSVLSLFESNASFKVFAIVDGLPSCHVSHHPPRFRFTWVHMTQDPRDVKEAAVVRDQDRFCCFLIGELWLSFDVSPPNRLPLSKEDCDVLNQLQRDPEGENEVLYPNQCSIVKGGESKASYFSSDCLHAQLYFAAAVSAKCIESCFKSFRALVAVITALKDPKYEERVQWAITILDSIMIEDELIRVLFATMDSASHPDLAPGRAVEIAKFVKQVTSNPLSFCISFNPLLSTADC
jgi:hypothetical protein